MSAVVVAAPPTYSRLPDTQLLVIPSSNAAQFQSGYLGVDEISSVEGEVHVKGALPGSWSRLTIALVTTERVRSSLVQLASHVLELYNALPSSAPGSSTNPSSSPPTTSHFSLPLTNDAPQPIRTPHSSLSHRLVATLYSSDATLEPLVTAQDIDIKRYSPLDPSLTPLVPRKYTIDTPIKVELQVARSVYRLGDIIPVYVTIPVPEREQITRSRLRLRNIKVELVRTTTILSHHSQGYSESSGSASTSLSPSSTNKAMSESSILSGDIPPTSPSHNEKFVALDHEEDSLLGSDTPSQFTTVLTRSGASARFHSSQPVRIRLLIRASALPSSPPQVPTDSSHNQGGAFECTITQHSTLHSVEFSLEVVISFLTQRPDRPEGSANAHAPPVQEYAKVSIPITLLPPPARKGEQGNEVDMEQAYHKKFDKPPMETNRVANADVGPPGPSASGAPPPFDERDAPPPPFVQSDPHSMQAGTSRLPTFLESEAHYVVPLPGPSSTLQTPYGGYVPTEGSSNRSQSTATEEDPDRLLELEGEGRLFGFRPEQQFDGLEASFGSSAEPPPAIENVQEDTDVTALADLVDRPERALEAIGRGMGVASAVDPGYASHREDEMDNLEHALRLDVVEGPAPPFVDDPADPPPGIDMEFRTSPPPFLPPAADQPPLIDSQVADLPPPLIEDEPLPRQEIENPSQRPPPYLTTPNAPSDGQHGPPPSYVDLRPSA